MIEVEVAFHGPFRVSQGTGWQGVDQVAHRDRIPASSLKGVMKAAAAHRLGLPASTVARLFGTTTHPCPWAWGDMDLLDAQRRVTNRVRIPIDPATGVAARRGLFLAEEVWVAGRPSFQIDAIGPAGARGTDDPLLLAACAMAVKSLGAARRRGLGWVGMQPRVSGQAVTPDAAAAAVIKELAANGGQR
jgi:CRISPR/Cas system CSM-associated protein Csm3 (group 7 of RAMP superfamily)